MRSENHEHQRYREMLDQLLRSLPAFPEHRFDGRGIVLCGGGDYFPCVWVCVRMLRSLGCTLPIELWHRGPHEMTDEIRVLMEPYGVICQDAFVAARQYPVHRLDGWELKPYAILNSRFAEVLYIDADNVAVQNPEFLFDSELYQRTGSLFWPDMPNDTSSQSYLKDVAWELLDLPSQEELPFESGQLLIDKRRSWSPMQLTLYLNEHSDYYYTAFFGDKDTFHLAWRKLGQEFSLIPHPPAALSKHRVLVQFDPEGKRLFQHRCNAKWTITERNTRIPGFLFEEECLAFLNELKARGPMSFGDLSLTPAEQIARDEILRTRTFQSYWNDQEYGLCIFQPDFTVTLNGQSLGWQLEEDKDGKAVLIFTDAGKRAAFLRKTSPGTWSGRWRFGERPWLELSR